MENSNIIDSNTLNRDAYLNTLIYLISDHGSTIPTGTSVNEIINIITVSVNQKIDAEVSNGTEYSEAVKKYKDDFRKIDVLNKAINNDSDLGNLLIANQTYNMKDPSTGETYNANGLFACTFQDSVKNPKEVTVVYRGTGAGEWYDNGIALSGKYDASPQQKQATEYFDNIVKNNGWNESKPDIYITGHSKGGNKAQYVVMTSKYSDLIINGYSIDGQCLSPEAIEYLINRYGKEEYDKRRNKLYSFAADNDYVNILGANDEYGRIIPKEHIFYLASNMSLVSWHYPDCIIKDDGTLSDFVEQGIFSKSLENISESVMALPYPIRSIITDGAMSIAEMFLGNGQPINGEKMTYRDIMTSVMLLIDTIPGGAVRQIGDEFNVDLDWLANATTAFYLIYFGEFNLVVWQIGCAIDILNCAKEELKKCGEKCKELTNLVIKFINDGISAINNFYNNNFNAGYQYATANTQILIDTYKLRNYAQRLDSVNKRVKDLDIRLKSLYGKIGLLDLFNLIRADILIGESWKISCCSDYLRETADDFDNVEREIMKNI